MRYKFRAECWEDIDAFVGISDFKRISIDSINKTFPDIVMVIESKLELDDLRNEMRKVPDGHVMVQTVELEENYTGQRKYEL